MLDNDMGEESCVLYKLDLAKSAVKDSPTPANILQYPINWGWGVTTYHAHYPHMQIYCFLRQLLIVHVEADEGETGWCSG